LFDKSYTNVLVKGPASNLPEAREFRNFWGDKSELRRFQDSTICEAVYFESNTIAEKRVVYSKIIKHIMKL
jgi:U3 small nucleolar RNA-associated protein 22